MLPALMNCLVPFCLVNAFVWASARHPKLVKLVEVLTDHFSRAKAAGRSTRAIVFTQYRDSVGEIVSLLGSTPLVKAASFVGQATSSKSVGAIKGQTQKEQQSVVRLFREGTFNTLVATCIGEEGLDVGDVDLIVSYDAVGSPTRMVQRMGRTGRKRAGRVVVLVTEGNEHRKLKNAQAKSRSVNRLLRPGHNDKFIMCVGVPAMRVCARSWRTLALRTFKWVSPVAHGVVTVCARACMPVQPGAQVQASDADASRSGARHAGSQVRGPSVPIVPGGWPQLSHRRAPARRA